MKLVSFGLFVHNNIDKIFDGLAGKPGKSDISLSDD